MSTAIEKVKEKEKQIFELKKELAALRRQVPLEEIQDYSFLDSFGNTVKLSQLFGGKRELILIHNMGTSCSYCTLWADGINGFTSHLENQAAFVVESMDDPTIQRRLATDRGWKFKMVSSKRSSFRKDVGFADKEDGSPWPGVSTFVLKDSKIYRASSAMFGPGDNYCALWDLLDLLPREVDPESCGIEYYYLAPKMAYGQSASAQPSHKEEGCCG